MLKRIPAFLGSLKMAVALLIAIAAVLGWGTIYESRFGTAAVQRFIYRSWWFEGLLAFLAVNLTVSAFHRIPWKRRHAPFLLAHLGIILLLAGGVLGGRFGVEGRMVIPEGQASSILELPHNVLAVHQPNPGIYREFSVDFETKAWEHHPHRLFEIPMGDQPVQLLVDRYYPNASVTQEVSPNGEAENPAIHILFSHAGTEDAIWLFARDRERFGARWGGIHVFFFQTENRQELERVARHFPHCVLFIELPDGGLLAYLARPRGLQKISPLVVGKKYLHPDLQYGFKVSEHYPRAKAAQHFVSQGDEVRNEALHVMVRRGEKIYDGWLSLRGSQEFPLLEHPLRVEFRPGLRPLPFSVKLLDFRKIDYPGTEMASGFESDLELKDQEKGLTVRRTISMNNPLKYRGFTFYQSSYIPGAQETTVLSVRNDPGTPLVYGGFMIIVLGVVTLFLQRSRAAAAAAALALLLCLGFAAGASAQETNKLSRQTAVLHNGRVKPLDSLARESLRHITGAPAIGGEDPLATLFSIMNGTKNWQQEPIIQVPFIPLRQALGLSPKTTHVSYDELVATRRLMRMLPAIVEKQQQGEKLSMLEQETMDLYDRFVSFHNLVEGKVTVVAGTPMAPAAWRLQWEVIYNRAAPFRWARWIYLAACVGFLFAMARGKSAAGFGSTALLAAFLFHAAGIVSRVVLGGRPPVSNFYETMLWLPFVGVVLSFILGRIYRVPSFGFAGSLLAALTLWIADFSPLDPSIAPVVAVLRSNLWLTIHVLTMVGSYAPIALAVILAHICTIVYLRKGSEQAAPLELFIYRALQVGVVLLASGIMLGAVWANASWGRYWGWDPKETWALITLLWFLAVLHGRFAGWLKGVGFALAVVGGFFPLLMTYYGVSFYLVGLHSYAGGHAKPLPVLLVGYLAAEIAFIAAAGLVAMKRGDMIER